MIFFKRIVICFIVQLSLSFCEENRVVLVTGGAGYIGSHMCKALKEAGFTPVTYDSLALGEATAVKWGPLVVGNLLDTETLDKAFITYKPCAVIHFAALRNVGESIKEPSNYYTNNVAGSISLLNAMLKHEVKHIVFSSSCTVYGNSPISPLSEESPKMPISPYAMSKHIVERIIKDYAYAYQFKYMILRYFNASGVDVENGLKRSSHSCNFLIPRALLAILHPENPLQVLGTNYPTPDGTGIRDYIHVKDLANAHLLALQHLQEGKENNEINLGTGKGYSVMEIIQAIETVTGRQVPFEVKPPREGDSPEAVASVKKAKEVLNFEPSFSDLHNMIESEWISIQNTDH